MADTDREVLFSNESFVIGVIQAVAGGSTVAALSQFQVLVDNVGRSGVLTFLTFMLIALLFSILAAYWKHQYKLWDIKAVASRGTARTLRSGGNIVEAEAKETEATDRGKRSDRHLAGMRFCMAVGVCSVIGGLAALIVLLWQGVPGNAA